MSNLNLFSNLILNRVIDQVNHVIGRSSRTNDHNQTKSNTNSNSNGLLISFLSSFEPYFVSLQSLLIREKPYLSAIAFVTLNCLFWWANVTFYMIMFLMYRYFHCIIQWFFVGFQVYNVMEQKILLSVSFNNFHNNIFKIMDKTYLAWDSR